MYPIAQKLHANQAAKLTGMLVESILSLKTTKSDTEIFNILQVDTFITELVYFNNIFLFLFLLNFVFIYLRWKQLLKNSINRR